VPESGRKHVDSRLLVLMDKARGEAGVKVQDLQVNDVLEVETESGSVYTLKVLNPKELMVEASGGKFGPKLTTAHVSNCIAVGNRFIVGNVLLSETCVVKVNGVQVLPCA